MPLERGYTMITISFEGRELLRTLAHQRHKPMYEVLVEAITEALECDRAACAATDGSSVLTSTCAPVVSRNPREARHGHP